ncbi:MAG: aldo/keto reductase [Bacteroidaceae bacterium]|nr:aldo/keto reductase [Bacteroidaceae bacterium]
MTNTSIYSPPFAFADGQNAEGQGEGLVGLRRAGRSGILLPVLSLGLWHNFGSVDDFSEAERMILHAFDHGICHFDLANNYGPVPGSAEENFGRIWQKHLRAHRDELFISSKAGHDMWPGPYGTGSSRKNLMASIDQSLRRTGLDYFDIFYSHRYDGFTPIEETMQALIDIARQGKALYVGISKYPPQLQKEAYRILREAHVPCLLSQYRYNLLTRDIEKENLPLAAAEGSGFVAFSPLCQGLLTDKYLGGTIPADSRAARPEGFLRPDQVTPQVIDTCRRLNAIAQRRGQTLSQMALAWALRDERVTSVIIGTRTVQQMDSSLAALHNLDFTPDELAEIDAIASRPH